MAQCSDCYNGCIDITSDKCVRYTGVNVPALDIKTGDSLSFVQQALITFLTATIDGSGIQITIAPADYCTLVTKYLQTCETVTALDLFRALVKAACDIQGQIDAINVTLTALNASYSTECLTGVTVNSDTHDIVQAIITKLCAVDTALTALALDVDTNYVKLSELNSLIAAYIASTGTSTRYYTRMVPFSAVEYYGSLAGFDASGAGILNTEWEKIYLCNGDNGTPDKRGRVGVGATSTPGVLAMASAVDPAVAGNPAYTLLDSAHGQNTIVLNTTQIPGHAHSITDVSHTHLTVKDNSGVAGNTTRSAILPTGGEENSGITSSYILKGNTLGEANVGLSSASNTGLSTTNSSGGGLSHDNYQPGLGCYYIMYIP